VPLGSSFTNSIVGLPSQDGDQVFTWNAGIQDLDGTFATYSTFSHSWDNTAININAGLGFFYANAGTNVTAWSRTYSVPQTP